MRTACRSLVVGWLLVAVVLLALDGRLLVFAAWILPLTVFGLGTVALVRQQRAPSLFDPQPKLPPRYRVADDLRLPLESVIAVAEQEAGREQ
jgi:hypothetical protein